jgi:transposase-like protein
MRIQRRYPLALEAKIVSEYGQGSIGYKKLAKKYGIAKNLIRGWVEKRRKKCLQEKNVPMSEKTKFKNLKEEVEYLRDAHMFWKTYAELILKEDLESKKKDEKLKQSKKPQKKDQKS